MSDSTDPLPVSILDPPAIEDPVILVVDDESAVREGVARALSTQGFQTNTAANAEAALGLLIDNPTALVITDINMPGHDGVWLLHQLRDHHPDAAVIMMTAFAQLDTAIECLRNGASDYLTKPVRLANLFSSVRRALDHRRLVLENRAYQRDLERRVREATQKLRDAYQGVSLAYGQTLQALMRALDAREHETGDHSSRVVGFTLVLADVLGVSPTQREELARGALIHDIGKIGIPDEVLLKPGPLNGEEWGLMREHPEIGHRILRGIGMLREASQVVRCHHERWDGSGYPKGLGGEQIPFGARVFSVADALDAITSDRPYRKAQSIEKAVSEIAGCSGTQFDPRVVQALLQVPMNRLEQLRQSPPVEAADVIPVAPM